VMANERELSNLAYTIENTLLILWRHLEYFFTQKDSIGTEGIHVGSTIITVSELQDFKKDAQTIFVRQIHPQKESILTRLTDVEKAIKPTNNIVYHVVRKLRDALR